MQEASRSSPTGLAAEVSDELRRSHSLVDFGELSQQMDFDRSGVRSTDSLQKDVVAHGAGMVGRIPSGKSIHSSVTNPSSVGVAPPRAEGLTLKRVLDVFGAILMMVAFLPLTVPILLVLSLSRGSVFYSQTRIGMHGKAFKCFKLRTMVPDADQVLKEMLERDPEFKTEWLRDHKLRDDPRVTTVGYFLRRSSFDELPQIWNVIRGDMSLVGPRPVVKEELLRYRRGLSAYLSVRPGISGLWQVSGRNQLSYRRRVAIDVYYVRNRSLRLDMYILLKTVSVIVSGGGAC